MKIIALLFAVLCGLAQAQTATVTDRENRGFQPMRGTSNIGKPVATEAECKEVIRQQVLVRQRTELYKCRNELVKLGTYSAAPPPVVCPQPPAPTVATVACVAPLQGSWQQTTTVSIGPAPTCTRTVALSPASAPAGACVTPPPPATGPVLHFSDCQQGAAAGCVPGSNANPGTEALPKQNLAGTNVNALPAGAALRFKRGGAWGNVGVMLENPNATAANPLTFEPYGTGPAPLLRQCSGNMFNVGGNWGNTTNDGGYVFRGLKLDGCGSGEWGLWFVQNVRDVVLDEMEITGFRIALNSNDGAPHGVRGLRVLRSNINRNRAMGILGHYNDLTLDGNTWEANNFGGSTFDHAIYIGGGTNITIRNNLLSRNSVVNGQCTGGNMTFHGQINGLLIEGNRIEQDAAAPGCWLMSITRGYSSAEAFRNVVVRNNRLRNGGNTAMAAQSAPGITVEGNVVINTRPTQQTAFNIGSGSQPAADGDIGDGDAIVRNNTVCQGDGASGAVATVNSPGSTVTNNVLRRGAEATTGVCAP